MFSSAQIKALKARTDICAVAQRYTQLRRVSARGEYAGPCPHCRHPKHFHVHREGWWFCRDCHSKRADVIALIQWLEDCDFVTACQKLGALPSLSTDRAPPPPPPPTTASAWRTHTWQHTARRQVHAAVTRLAGQHRQDCRAYLAARGLVPATWQAWQVGMITDHAGTPMIVFPWILPDEQITAIKYRRIGDVAKERRYIQMRHSTQLVFGTQLLSADARILILVEGELNALSLWQVCRGTSIGVISFGSESGTRAIDAAVHVARSVVYPVVWCDKSERAETTARKIGPHATAIQSPQGHDANDLLQQHMLQPFLAHVLAQHVYPSTDCSVAQVGALLRRVIGTTDHFVPPELCCFDEDTPREQRAWIRTRLEAMLHNG